MLETAGLKDPRNIRIDVQGTKLGAVYTLDDDAAPDPGSFDGWKDQQRDRRLPILTWSGPEESRSQTFGVFIDAFGENRAGRLAIVKNQMAVLRALQALPHPGAPPPVATLTGLSFDFPQNAHPNQNWALRSMTPRERLYDNDTGDLVRWAGTLVFSQIAQREVLRITSGPHVGFRMHVVKKGETLAKIAQTEHVKIVDIKRRDGSPIRDPKTVKVGDVLRLPPRSSR
jgi:hypothetical protein